MRGLNAVDMVRVWEWGANRAPVDQGLALLSIAFPDRDRDELASWTLGQRDGWLLRLRAATLGSSLELYVQCPHCDEDLEFELQCDQLLVADPAVPAPPGTVQHDALTFVVRPPTSLDLAAVASLGAQLARAEMVRRCVTEATGPDGNVSVVPPGAIATLIEAMSTIDPQVDLRFELQCDACGSPVRSHLDVLQYFWEEISAHVRRLTYDVATLARAYGWSETDILRMSDERRKWYLELAAQ